MTKTQRTIILFLPAHAVTLFLCYYLTHYWFIGAFLQVGLTGLMMRRLLAGGSRAAVIAKSSQPVLFILLSSLYFMLLAQISGISLIFFASIVIVIVAIYGLLSFQVLKSELKPLASSMIALLLTVLSSGFMILAQAYWHIPTVVALPLVWLIAISIALWWLLEITRDNKGILPLATIWALVCCELSWMYSHWIVVYQLPKINFIIAQPAIVITALAYSSGGIFYHQRHKRLTIVMAIEYLAVFFAALALTLIFTRWIAVL